MTEVVRQESPQCKNDHIQSINLYGNIITSPYKSLSISIKGLILNGLIQQKNKREYTVKDALLTWQNNVKVLNLTSQAMMRILIRQSISEQTFLYRIKAFAYQKMKSQKYQKKKERSIKQNQQKDQQNYDNNRFISQEFKKKAEEDIQQVESPFAVQFKEERNSCDSIQIKRFEIERQQCKSSFIGQKFGQINKIGSKQKQFLSKSVIQQNTNQRLQRIEVRIKIGSLRACQLLVKRRIFMNKRQAFGQIRAGLKANTVTIN